jgi:hypothetical protein
VKAKEMDKEMDVAPIIAVLDAFQDVDDKQQMDAMIEAVKKLTDSPQSEATESLFHVFERFPEHDGYETFWSILHLLERTPGYERELVNSLARQPNEFNVVMVNRMLNAKIKDADGVDLIGLLRQVVINERAPADARKRAQDYINRHST